MCTLECAGNLSELFRGSDLDMDLGLAGKRAVVTGASRGIGRAVVESLSQEGCAVDLVARSEEDLRSCANELCAKYGVPIHTHRLDVGLQGDREVLFGIASETDILVNCAGSIPIGSIEDIDDDLWLASWESKVFGYISLTRGFYIAMRNRGAGVIVNIIGDAGVRLSSSYIAGSAGNAGLMALTAALGATSTDHGVRVLGVNPGLTASGRSIGNLKAASEKRFKSADRWTDIVSEMKLPFGRMANPAEVADVVAFMASPRASYVSGTIVTVDGGRYHRR